MGLVRRNDRGGVWEGKTIRVSIKFEGVTGRMSRRRKTIRVSKN